MDILSYNISCDHITKLNDKYTKNNDEIYNRQFICNFINDNNNINDNNDNNINDKKYIKSLYITKKSCIYSSTEPDNFEWTANFNLNNDIIKYKDDNAIALFNVNTRRKILTRY